MPTPTALIVTTAGINCEEELAAAFEQAGARAELVHLNRLLAEPAIIDDFDLIGLPGGFSYGDAIAAGRIAAHLMRKSLYDTFTRAVARGVPIIAPCNGFQMAVQLGLLPGVGVEGEYRGGAEGRSLEESDSESESALDDSLRASASPRSSVSAPPEPTVALMTNASARFVDRWVRISIPENTRCIWTAGLTLTHAGARLPIAHGEGRFIAQNDAAIDELDARGQIALRYAADDNPNGSMGDVAGICDPTGLVFGLMPHPERFTRWEQHPFWTRLDEDDRAAEPIGLQMFQNAMQWQRSKGQKIERSQTGEKSFCAR